MSSDNRWRQRVFEWEARSHSNGDKERCPELYQRAVRLLFARDPDGRTHTNKDATEADFLALLDEIELAPLTRKKGTTWHDETTPEQYVTLDQAAALVNRSKKTLERYLRNPKSKAAQMPAPDVEGFGGKPHEWRWGTLRPWLEKTFGKKLPERLPSRSSRPRG
jgi:hypothetical protein